MTAAMRPLIGVGQSLPRLRLPLADGRGSVSLGDGTYGSVVVFPHPSCCSCEEWLSTLAEVVEDLRLWATRPLVVLSEGVEEAAQAALALALPYPVLADPGGLVRARLGLRDDVAALIVADRWGAAYEVTLATEDHPVPHAGALVRLAQDIDLQCAECGVAGTEWRQCTPLPLG